MLGTPLRLCSKRDDNQQEYNLKEKMSTIPEVKEC